MRQLMLVRKDAAKRKKSQTSVEARKSGVCLLRTQKAQLGTEVPVSG